MGVVWVEGLVCGVVVWVGLSCVVWVWGEGLVCGVRVWGQGAGWCGVVQSGGLWREGVGRRRGAAEGAQRLKECWEHDGVCEVER